MKYRLLILGATGMLGNAVTRYFTSLDDYAVTVTVRSPDEVILLQCAHPPQVILFDALTCSLCQLGSEYDYAINCIGLIKNFSVEHVEATIQINALFPWKLESWCSTHGIRLLHVTTDCVYSGQKGLYVEKDLHDATDVYGKTKSLGECVNKTMVLRTSLIGEELHGFYSLISWTKKQKGLTVDGYANHFWNGITTWQYAKICHTIFVNNWYEPGLFHAFAANDVTKLQLLSLLNLKYQLSLKIREAFPHPINRTLRTTKTLCQKLCIPTVEEMIQEI